MTEQQNIQAFEKTIAILSDADILKLINSLTIETLYEFRDKKTPAAAIVTIDQQTNFVIMYFYRTHSKMCGFQYVINFNVSEQNTNVLCLLFTKYALRMQRLGGKKSTHSVKNLIEYYCLKIKGYKDHLKQPKQ